MLKKIQIVTFTGPSGAGKTTIVGELLKNHSECKMILSLTSRGPRNSDLSGEYRCKVTNEEFLRREREGEFMWLVSFHGNIYGTLLTDINAALNSNRVSLMQITPDSVKSLRAYAPGKILSIFILLPDEEELRRRLEKRGELPKEIDRRIADCREWEKEARESRIPYKFIRNDGTVTEAIDKVGRIGLKRLFGRL